MIMVKKDVMGQQGKKAYEELMQTERVSKRSLENSEMTSDMIRKHVTTHTGLKKKSKVLVCKCTVISKQEC